MTTSEKRKQFLKRLLFVPRCAGCGIRLSPIARDDNLTYGKVCICPECIQKWQIAKRDMCHTCFMPAGECTCTNINRKIKQPFIPSLFFYHQNRALVQNKIIFSAKTKHYPELFEFLSLELAPHIDRLIAERGADRGDCILTWIPRGKASVRKYGHDQAKILCLELSKALGIAALPLLIRRGGKEQKKLDNKKRASNIESSVFLNEKLRGVKLDTKSRKAFDISELIAGKTIIVVDDIITTGASMRRAILLLEPKKPAAVLTSCVARCEIKSK
jgi:predicted amidophosphoribosyltransferase